jgi:DNA-binding CsgD family transcriptional regulator
MNSAIRRHKFMQPVSRCARWFSVVNFIRYHLFSVPGSSIRFLVGVKKIVFLYGIALAVLVLLLKGIEYSFLIRDLSIELYVGLIAALFAAIGVWGGWRLTAGRSPGPALGGGDQPVRDQVAPDGDSAARSGITRRELEELDLIAQGLSNQEIADRLFVSLHTVKKHTSSLFVKLDARRRTHAVERAKQLGILR